MKGSSIGILAVCLKSKWILVTKNILKQMFVSKSLTATLYNDHLNNKYDLV